MFTSKFEPELPIYSTVDGVLIFLSIFISLSIVLISLLSSFYPSPQSHPSPFSTDRCKQTLISTDSNSVSVLLYLTGTRIRRFTTHIWKSLRLQDFVKVCWHKGEVYSWCVQRHSFLFRSFYLTSEVIVRLKNKSSRPFPFVTSKNFFPDFTGIYLESY